MEWVIAATPMGLAAVSSLESRHERQVEREIRRVSTQARLACGIAQSDGHVPTAPSQELPEKEPCLILRALSSLG